MRQNSIGANGEGVVVVDRQVADRSFFDVLLFDFQQTNLAAIASDQHIASHQVMRIDPASGKLLPFILPLRQLATPRSFVQSITLSHPERVIGGTLNRTARSMQGDPGTLVAIIVLDRDCASNPLASFKIKSINLLADTNLADRSLTLRGIDWRIKLYAVRQN